MTYNLSDCCEYSIGFPTPSTPLSMALVDDHVVCKNSSFLHRNRKVVLDSLFFDKTGKHNPIFPAMIFIKYGDCSLPFNWVRRKIIDWQDLPRWCLLELADYVEHRDKGLYKKIVMELWTRS